MRTLTTLIGAAFLAACSTGGDTADDTAAAADTTMTGAPAGGAMGAGGLPAGYMAFTDSEREPDISNASYTMADGRWEVRTGPRHIVYSAADTARGDYTASATIELASMPEHAEAFGLFVGGTELDQPTRRYTYFLVRHTGEYLVTVREGADTRSVVPWTASPAVPQGAPGTSYMLAARVSGDSVTFMVNDQAVTTVPRAGLPTDGVAGLRINHNLHLRVTPLSVN